MWKRTRGTGTCSLSEHQPLGPGAYWRHYETLMEMFVFLLRLLASNPGQSQGLLGFQNRTWGKKMEELSQPRAERGHSRAGMSHTPCHPGAREVPLPWAMLPATVSCLDSRLVGT